MFSRVLEVAAFEAFSYVCNQTISAISRFDFKNNILTLYHNISFPFNKLKQVNAACQNQTFGNLSVANHTFYEPHAISAPNTTHTHLVPCTRFTNTDMTSMVQQVRQLQREQGVTMLGNTDAHALLNQFSEYENQLRPQLVERYSDIERVTKNVALWEDLRATIKTDVLVTLMFMLARNNMIKKGMPKKHIEHIMSTFLLILSTITSGSLDSFRFMMMTSSILYLLPKNFRYKTEVASTMAIAFTIVRSMKDGVDYNSFDSVKMIAGGLASLLTRYVVNGLYEQLSPRFRFFNSLPDNAQVMPVAVIIRRIPQ